jgi:predicted PurR-regulated permease PerM
MNTPKDKLDSALRNTIEISIRLGFLLLLAAWCFKILFPFTGVILWGMILALALAPVYSRLNRRIGDKPKRAATILILFGLIVIAIPSALFVESMVSGIKELKLQYASGTLSIPPPGPKVANWPLIGKKIAAIWQQASDGLPAFIDQYRDQLGDIAKAAVNGLMSVGASIVQFVFSIIIAGILLATKGTDQAARDFFTKIAGKRGDEFTDIIIKTVQNVTKGILGVAIIQSVLIGIGFLLAGVPYAGLWALIVMILAILQLPPLIVVIPIIIYLFSAMSPIAASLWTIYLLLAGATDNVLKPILLGKGAPVPMLIIFLGAIGGFMLSGFIGLFTGAIVLSLGYKLFIAWLKNNNEEEEEAFAPPPAIDST